MATRACGCPTARRRRSTTNVVISAVGALHHARSSRRSPGCATSTARWCTPRSGTRRWSSRASASPSSATAPAPCSSFPPIADTVQSLTVFQRSKQWAAPFAKFRKSGARAGALPVPRGPALRVAVPPAAELGLRQPGPRGPAEGPGVAAPRALDQRHQRRAPARSSPRYIEEQLADRPDLVDKVTPHFPPFGKRMLLDNGWYKALASRTSPWSTRASPASTARRSTPRGGEEHEVDVLVVATGYDVTRFLSPVKVVGRGGMTVREAWDDDDSPRLPRHGRPRSSPTSSCSTARTPRSGTAAASSSPWSARSTTS